MWVKGRSHYHYLRDMLLGLVSEAVGIGVAVGGGVGVVLGMVWVHSCLIICCLLPMLPVAKGVELMEIIILLHPQPNLHDRSPLSLFRLQSTGTSALDIC
jgi:hypothetical protein